MPIARCVYTARARRERLRHARASDGDGDAECRHPRHRRRVLLRECSARPGEPDLYRRRPGEQADGGPTADSSTTTSSSTTSEWNGGDRGLHLHRDTVYQQNMASPVAPKALVATVTNCPANVPTTACDPSYTTTGADHRSYRVDTYLYYDAPSWRAPAPDGHGRRPSVDGQLARLRTRLVDVRPVDEPELEHPAAAHRRQVGPDTPDALGRRERTCPRPERPRPPLQLRKRKRAAAACGRKVALPTRKTCPIRTSDRCPSGTCLGTVPGLAG